MFTQWKPLGVVFPTLSLAQLIPHQLELCKTPFLLTLATHTQMPPGLKELEEQGMTRVSFKPPQKPLPCPPALFLHFCL